MAVEYLRILGVKTEYARSNFIDKAIELRKVTPNKTNCLQDIKYPALWTSGVDLHHCIDTPMHHIFEGVVRTVTDHITIWLKKLTINATFADANIDIMTKIKNLRLEWCKLELITCGGWVGESWLAYTRLLPLFYMQVIKLVDPLCYDIKPMTRLVQSVYICVCHIMMFPPLNPSTIDDAIKIFLSCCQNFCHYTSTAKIPWWLSCGNLISLLNCPGQIE